MSMTTGTQTWVAAGPAGTVGSIHRDGEGFLVRVRMESEARGPYPTLEAAKRALHATLGPGAERPDFREH
ncbi:MAG: methyltransferase [Actinomycetes bacterium]